MRKWQRWAVGVALGVAGLVGAVFAGAWLLKDESGIARAIIWMEADTGDHERFPERTIDPSPQPDPLATDPVDLGSVEIQGRTLDELLDESETTAFVALRGDTIAYERYFGGHERASVQTSFSIAKSFASALVGVAIADGEIRSVRDPITRYLPELLERDPGFAEITIEHLMTMTSGLRYEEDGLPWGDDAQTYYGTDLRDLALTDTEIVEPPGTRWHYNNYNPLLLGMILEHATGTPVADYLEAELWQPLGAEFEASWSLDSDDSGFEKMESGINARAIDFARLGVLYLDGGSWQGRQVVPRAWVRRSTSPAAAAPHYGYWWWLEPDGAFIARGNLGQIIYVDPARHVVVARFGSSDGDIAWAEVCAQVSRALGAERPPAA
jgi:CubicO group peptidase (beta-lactamase class C family)